MSHHVYTLANAKLITADHLKDDDSDNQLSVAIHIAFSASEVFFANAGEGHWPGQNSRSDSNSADGQAVQAAAHTVSGLKPGDAPQALLDAVAEV